MSKWVSNSRSVSGKYQQRIKLSKNFFLVLLSITFLFQEELSFHYISCADYLTDYGSFRPRKDGLTRFMYIKKMSGCT